MIASKVYQCCYMEGTEARYVIALDGTGSRRQLGSGSTTMRLNAVTAWCILADAFNKDIATRLSDDFTEKVISKCPEKSGWFITKESIVEMYKTEIAMAAIARIS